MGVPTTIQIYLSVAIPCGIGAGAQLLIFLCVRASWPQFFCAARPDHPLSRAGPCEYIRGLVTLNEAQVLSTTGVDGLAYVLFQQFGLQASAFACMCGLVVLGPVFYHGDALGNAHGFDRVSFANIGRSAERSADTAFWALWLMCVVAYAQQLFALWLLHHADRRVCAAAAQAAAEGTARKYAVVVTDVPDDGAGAAGRVATARLMIATALGNDDALLYARAIHVTHPPRTLADIRLGGMSARLQKYEAALDALAHAHAAEVKTDEDGKPQPMAGLCGRGLLTVVQQRTVELTTADASVRALLATRDAKRQSLNPEAAPADAHAVLAVVNTLRAATMLAAAPLTADSAESWNVAPAPEPRDVDWDKLETLPSAASRRARASVAAALFVGLTVFWTIPVSFVSALTQLEMLEGLMPWLGPILDTLGEGGRALVQGLLPVIALVLLMELFRGCVLPGLARAAGAWTHSAQEAAVQRDFTIFLLCHLFLVVTLSGSLFESLDGILAAPFSIFALLGAAVPSQASFFNGYLTLRTAKALNGLTRVVPFVVMRVKRFLLLHTGAPSEAVLALDKPGPAAYGVPLAWDQLAFAISMTYAAMAPLTAGFGAAYFACAALAARSSLGLAQVSCAASNGRYWRTAVPQALGALQLAQVTLIGVVTLKGGFLQSLALIPLVLHTSSQRGTFVRRHAASGAADGSGGDTFVRHGGLEMPLDAAARCDVARCPDAVARWMAALVDDGSAWAPPQSLPLDAAAASALLGVPVPEEAAAKHAALLAWFDRQAGDDYGEWHAAGPGGDGDDDSAENKAAAALERTAQPDGYVARYFRGESGREQAMV